MSNRDSNAEESASELEILTRLMRPESGKVLSSLTSISLVYLAGLSLLLAYLYLLRISRDLILSLFSDLLVRNLLLILIGGVLTFIWLFTWYRVIILIRRFLSRDKTA
ncbi:MAG: hypothetical protein ABWJ42_05790 [Sulfolobales archaeon]